MDFHLSLTRRPARIFFLALLVPTVAFALQTGDKRSGMDYSRRPPESVRGAAGKRPCSSWIDLYRGEPIRYENMVRDLTGADVVYLGETHSIIRHHYLEEKIAASLCKGKRPVVVAMEQLEMEQQPVIDRFNRGEISFDELAAEITWEKTWFNFRDYRGVLERARSCGAAVIGMNASAALVKRIARTGLSSLSAKDRSLLPAEIDTRAGHYRTLLNRLLMVHAVMSPEHLDRFFEAQAARDETMASVIAGRLSRKPADRVRVIVIGGSMHFAWGLGVPARVRRRVAGVKERIVIFSESGELVLSPMQRKMAEKVTITRRDLQKIPRPVADYVHIICRGDR